MDTSVLMVEAIHPFKGRNNDELCFKKGAIITVTQSDDETWWEGTLDGNTGWFPANYVKEITQPEGANGSSHHPSSPSLSPLSEQQMFRALVLRNILDSERQHISELKSLLSTCLKPLVANKLLHSSDFSTLVRNLERVVTVHEQFLSLLEAEGEKSSADQKVGGVFLKTVASTLTDPQQQYCSQHPKAVAFIQEHKNEVNKCVESSGVCTSEDGHKKPGILVLTTGLSKPFRRLQQYPGLLQELHRHLPEAHKDRGDAQRAAIVMSDFAASCTTLRRQKELELEVVTAKVAGWDKGTLGVLGEVRRMGSVTVLPNHSDRYLVLFPKHLVILGISQRMSNFIFQSQMLLSDVSCQRLDDCDLYKNAFEINVSGVKSETVVAECQNKEEVQQWLSVLSSLPPTLPAKNIGQLKKVQPPLPPHKSPPAPPALSPLPSHCLTSSGSPSVSSGLSNGSHKVWGLCDLRPSPPLRPHQLKRMKTARKDEKWHDEDSIILRVVEAYCSSTATRYTQGKERSSSEEKWSRVSEGGVERDLLSAVNNLKAELSKLTREHETLKRQFERERQDSQKMRMVIANKLNL